LNELSEILGATLGADAEQQGLLRSIGPSGERSIEL